ncbi:MAG: galactokinase [Chitinophagaceae bacterium]|jgi:galactokinase|nr:galactokinase [Chitinophagaceae bacterium]
MNNHLIETLQSIYQQYFNESAEVLFSPGRINLLGEHIDYNDGFVLPAAIHLGIYAVFAPNDAPSVKIYAKDFDEWLVTDNQSFGPDKSWKNYVLSVLNQFHKRGIHVPGFHLVFGSDLPIGSGLSSSAALEGAISTAINHLAGNPLSAKELALLGQAAEHDYPGVKCGIMDQFANMLGKKDHIVRIDCMTTETDYLPLTLQDYRLVLVYSNVQHALTGGEYNERRQQCKAGLEQLSHLTGKTSFRDMTPEEVTQAEAILSPKVLMRCRYVVDEIQRTREAANHLQQGHFDILGGLMYQTHEGLSKLYEVSLPELDWLVAFAKAYEGVIGARLMGGGFGGCTLNLVSKDKAEAFAWAVQTAYLENFGIAAKIYAVNAVDGAHVLPA